jgi:hypothetical protein
MTLIQQLLRRGFRRADVIGLDAVLEVDGIGN